MNDATKATEDIIVENAFKKEFLAFNGNYTFEGILQI